MMKRDTVLRCACQPWLQQYQGQLHWAVGVYAASLTLNFKFVVLISVLHFWGSRKLGTAPNMSWNFQVRQHECMPSCVITISHFCLYMYLK